MKEDDKKRLKANHKYLVNTLRVVEIQDHLFQEDVISSEELEDLEAERTDCRKARLLLRLLPKKGNKAFSHFTDALNESNSGFVVEKLLCTKVSEFKESDYTDALHEEDKIKQLQSQMLLQTELFMAAKKEIDSLKQKVEKNEEEVKSRYSALDSVMAKNGLKQGHVVEILKDYLSSVDVPDMQVSHFSSPAPSPKFVKKESFTFTEEEIRSEQEAMCAFIARQIGKDIVKYVVQSSLKKTISEPKSPYCKTMRRIVDELITKYTEIFDNFITKINIEEISGYETLILMADELFKEGGNNWGRIVVLYAFSAYVARHSVENDMEKIATVIGDFLGFYVVKRLGPWINENGGWVSY